MSGWNSTLTRKTPFSKRPAVREERPRKPMPKLGRAGKLWAEAWRELKPKFEAAGITSCEIKRTNCTGSFHLDPVHSLKRRNCTTPALLREVCIGCRTCHAEIELLPESEMCLIVRGIIDARPHLV